MAIVTGAGSDVGIGFAIAKRLAAEGGVVYMTDIDEAAVTASSEAIRALGDNAVALRHDVTSPESWAGIFAKVVNDQGRLDILVNNAGISVTKAFLDHDLDDWNRTIAVNLTGPFLGMQHAVRQMQQTGGGAIVNISSIGGIVGLPDCAAYNPSKAGVAMLAKTVALEVAKDNIRVNSVHPGLIWTQMLRNSHQHDASVVEAAQNAIPARRMGTPDEIANCVLFLASEEAAYIHGAQFVVDGGFTAM